METITISKAEYQRLKQAWENQKQFTELLKDEVFLKKLEWAYSFFLHQKEEFEMLQKQTGEPAESGQNQAQSPKRATMKFGSGKHLISKMSDDFDAQIPGMEEYM